MLVKVIGDYTPPNWSILGAGGTPVAIAPVRSKSWDWLEADCPHSTGAVLLTGALWQKPPLKRSVPYPPTAIKAYAADRGIPWQSWKKVRAKATLGQSNQPQKRVQVLTPGEWLTLQNRFRDLEFNQPVLLTDLLIEISETIQFWTMRLKDARESTIEP